MYSTKGRPRQVTDAQVAAILAWHRSRKTLKQVARELGMPPSTVEYVIRRGGEYKQASPELRQVNLRAQRHKMKRLEAGGWI